MFDFIEDLGDIGTYSTFDNYDLVPISFDGSETELDIIRDVFFLTGNISIGESNQVIRLIDGVPFTGVGHCVRMCLPHMSDKQLLNADAERLYRESILAMSVERVVLQYVDIAVVRLASVRCESEDAFVPPTLHILFDDSVSKFTVQKVIIGLYMYLHNCGYTLDPIPEVTAEDRAFLDALDIQF